MTTHTEFDLPYSGEYGLSLEQAADRLLNEESIIASEFPGSLKLGHEEFPEPCVLDPSDFHGDNKDQIMKHLLNYDRFGIYP